MDIPLSQLNLECRTGGRVPGELWPLKNLVVELDDVARMQPRWGRAKNEKDVIAALRITGRKPHVHFANAGAHTLLANV